MTEGSPNVVDLIRERRHQPGHQHAAGPRRAGRRLRDPRGGDPPRHPLHHHPGRRLGGRAGDRAGPPGGAGGAAGPARPGWRPVPSLATRSAGGRRGSRRSAPTRCLVLAQRRRRGGRAGPVLHAAGRPRAGRAYLPRALSAAWADAAEIAFLLDVRGDRHQRPGGGRAGRAAGPAGPRLRARDGPALLVGGGIGAAILPWLVRDPAGGADVGPCSASASAAQAVCAALIDTEATVVLEPTLVTEPLARLLPFAGTVYACGPDPMLQAVAALCAEHAVRLPAGDGGAHGLRLRRLLRLRGARSTASGSGSASRGRCWRQGGSC